MKSMKKVFSANKVIGSLKKRTASSSHSPTRAGETSAPVGGPLAVSDPTSDQSPVTSANKSVKAFCESGGNVQGDEILFLPPIVDAAESSPAAAAECARVIRKYLHREYNSRPSWQYNALMLVRILTDNPGASFTRNLDAEFAETCRKLLKHGHDRRVRHMLMEMLDDFQHNKAYDPNLQVLVGMWMAQKDDALRKNPGPPLPPPQPRNLNAPPFNPHSQNYFARSHQTKRRLPDPAELASRLEEARTSAKLLEQVVMNTAPGEMLNNELIKEFAERCQTASRSIQSYMTCDSPSPDNETMETLIDTNEQLQTALNQHQRAVLNARKQLGLGAAPDASAAVSPASTNGHDRVLEWQQSQAQLYASGEKPEPPERPAGNGKGKETEVYHGQAGASGAGPSGSGQRRDEDDDAPLEDPFRDPQPAEEGNHQQQRHQFEPFNPGFASASGGDRANAAGGAGGSGAAKAGDNSASDDDNIYDAESKNKGTVYRY